MQRDAAAQRTSSITAVVMQGQEDPAAPHWVKLVVTDGMLRGGQITLLVVLNVEATLCEVLCSAVSHDVRPGQCIIVNLPPGVVREQIIRVYCQPPPAPYQPPPGPLLDLHLPPFPPMSLQALSRPAVLRPALAAPPKPRRCAPELRYLPQELLSAAATHRTGVEHYLDQISKAQEGVKASWPGARDGQNSDGGELHAA
jgi:hypothetical protein